MSELVLFKGKHNLPTMPEGFVDPVTDQLAGSTGTGRRISIRGKAFRQVINGKEVHVSEENLLDVVIISAAPISRMYYEGEYKEGESVLPTCWSADTVAPDAQVPAEDRQSKTCATCPHNVKGSGKGDSRACRFSQRIAVVLDGELEEEQVYQMQLPATSIFGDAEGNKMGMQAYARFLKANNAHAISLVTRMKFETAATQPKLNFSAVRPLTQDELGICIRLKDHPDTLDAITLTVGETDGATKKPAPSKAVPPEGDEDDAPPPAKKPAKAKAKPVVEDEDDEEEVEMPVKKPVKSKPAPVEEEEEDDVPEPVKAPKKKTAPPAEEPEELDSLLDEWDD